MSAVRQTSVFDRVRDFFVAPSAPRLALEFSSVALNAARVEWARGKPELRALASEPLSDGAFVPTLEDAGFVRREEIRDVAKRLLGRVGATSSARTAIVVPDIAARFRLFTHDEVAGESGKRESVIAFRMQKLLPFAPADTRFASAWPRSSADPVLGIGFSSAVLGAYEQVASAFGLDVGLVETSSMALLRHLPLQGDVLLVRHDPTWLTVTLVRNGWPVSIRSFGSAVARHPDEVRHEISSTAIFWRDRLSGERLSGAFLHAADSWIEGIGREVTSFFGMPPQRVQPPAALTVAGVPPAIERSAAPALALLSPASS